MTWNAIEKINKTKSFFRKDEKNRQILSEPKKKREKTEIIKIVSETKDITTNTTETQKM